MARLMSVVLAVFLINGCAAPRQGVLVMAHGGDPEWNRVVEETVSPLRAERPTEVAFGMADCETMQVAVEKLESRGAREIAVVRMFVSGDSFLPETEFILGVRPDLPAAAAHPTEPGAGDHGHHGHHMAAPKPIQTRSEFLISADGVAQSPLLDEILAARVQGLSKEPERECVLILAHGPGDDRENVDWLANMEKRAESIRGLGLFREVRCETLREDWPDKRVEAEQRIRDFVTRHGRDGYRVIVIPFRVAGFGPYEDVLKGLDYVSDGKGFCPHPNMTRWLAQAAESCFSQR